MISFPRQLHIRDGELFTFGDIHRHVDLLFVRRDRYLGGVGGKFQKTRGSGNQLRSDSRSPASCCFEYWSLLVRKLNSVLD